MAAWTEDEIASLLLLRGLGHSAAEIAASMPSHSRSAVLGRINRMGLSEPLPPALSPETRNKRRRERQAMAERNRAAKRRAQSITSRAPDGEPTRYVPQVVYQPGKARRFGDPIRDASGILRCIFPLNSFDGPNDNEMPVCDNTAKPESSYCAQHHSVCYQPTQTRRPANPSNHIVTDPRRRNAVA